MAMAAAMSSAIRPGQRRQRDSIGSLLSARMCAEAIRDCSQGEDRSMLTTRPVAAPESRSRPQTSALSIS
jgi:hypothetical protein